MVNNIQPVIKYLQISKKKKKKKRNKNTGRNGIQYLKYPNLNFFKKMYFQ